MKKISSLFALISLFGVGFLFSTTQAFAAAGSICPEGEFKPLCNLDLTNSSNLVGSIVTILLVLGIILSLIFLIIGSIRWITSSGDKAKLESARGTIVAAVVGLILAFFAFFILNVITYIFTGNTIRNFKVPTLVSLPHGINDSCLTNMT